MISGFRHDVNEICPLFEVPFSDYVSLLSISSVYTFTKTEMIFETSNDPVY